MQLANIFLLVASALASLSAAKNSVHFINQDSTTRIVVFTSQEDLKMPKIPNLVIKGFKTADTIFPTGWIGNWYSYNNGTENIPGMLGEVRFNGWNDLVFFDVSAIVNPADTEGVKRMYPVGKNPVHKSTPVSGCQTDGLVCATRYNAPDDIATMSTLSTALVCTLGNPPVAARRRDVKVYPRSFLTGESS